MKPAALVAIALLGVNLTWGQGEADFPIHFRGGLVGGVTASQIRGDGVEGFNKLGVHGGVLIEMRRYSNLGLQLGIVYNQKGSRKVANHKVNDYDSWRYKFTYFDIPLVAVYDFREGFTLGTGLQPGVLVNALQDGLYSNAVTGEWSPAPLPIRNFELSWVVWAGMRYGASGELFFRHTQSLLGIVPKPDVDSSDPAVRWDDRMQNITLQIGYTWLFTKGL